MFYKSGTLYEILELKDPKELFAYLIEPTYRGEYPYWSDILDGIEYFQKHSGRSYIESRYIGEPAIVELESLGLDVNHRDNAGQNFYMYILGENSSSSTNSSTKLFTDSGVTYVLNKTNDLISPNKYNRNILFHMLSFKNSGLEGEKFFAMLKQYPQLDLHLVDSCGRNLLFEAILRNAPNQITKYLIGNKVSLTQVDRDNYNLLNMFLSPGRNDEIRDLFNTVFEGVEDISLKTKYNKNFFDTHIEIASDNTLRQDVIDGYRYWLNYAFIKIQKGEFNKNLDIISNLITTLEENKHLYINNSPTKSARIYGETLATLNYFKLEMTMPSKEGTVEKKIKI